MTCLLRLILISSACTAVTGSAFAQISFSTAVDLALKNSPKVLMAQADVDKTRAASDQLRDAYIPSVVVGSALGPPSYGFPIGQPSIVNVTAQSLVFTYAQLDYQRAASSANRAAILALQDVRQGVVEDAATTYLALERDQKRQAALDQQQGFADRLVTIVQERLDAGQDTPMGLTSARLTAAQIHLARLSAEDETTADQAHLALLMGLPAQGITTNSSSVPAFLPPAPENSGAAIAASPAVESAYASAHAKRETAFGEAKWLWRPQISFFAEYSRYAEFNNYQDYYLHFQHNNAGLGVQINVPILDYGHKAKAREAAADAAHAEHEADSLRDQFFDSRLRARHSADELAVRSEIATLDQQLAQQQLDVMMLQVKNGTGNPNGPQMSPKDEQISRIAERDKYIALLNANFQLQTAQLSLMRQTGQLNAWIAEAASAPEPPAGPNVTLKP